MRTSPGIANLIRGGVGSYKGAKAGLVCHQASVTEMLAHSADVLAAHEDLDVVALFGPQHGIRGEKQDNMIESESFTDGRLAVPVYSLYGDVRKPTAEMLAGLDVLFFDLQDVGVRIYTFIWTMTLAMEACRDAGVRFVVLDRPNPVNGTRLEGRILESGFESFVGLHPVPLRHGLTTGEMARVANGEFGIGCELEVIPCKNWRREHWFDQTGLPWVSPSPNLPTMDSCIAYPGMVLLEGTNLSEGRGTTRPFEVFGAPFLDPFAVCRGLDACDLSGVKFRPCYFEPTFQKHAHVVCGGAQLHVTDRNAFRPVEAAVTILRVVRELAPTDFQWRPPPYEYEEHKMPIDILWGSETLRNGIDDGRGAQEIIEPGLSDIAEFQQRVAPYLLY